MLGEWMEFLSDIFPTWNQNYFKLIFVFFISFLCVWECGHASVSFYVCARAHDIPRDKASTIKLRVTKDTTNLLRFRCLLQAWGKVKQFC